MTEPLPGRDVEELKAVLQPFDEVNERLLENVHPPDWINPEPADRYHLVVVGAGTAGLVTAAGAAGLGARVALVEKRLMGGDCLNHGCVPSKAVIRAAKGWHDARTAAARFGGPQASGDGDFAAAMRRMRELRAGISHHDSAERFRGLGVDVFIGEGRFVAADAVEVDGRRLRFRKAAVATGTRAFQPPIPGLGSCGYLTNETIFNTTRRPPRLGILGAGPIGVELAQAFARFGSRVTLFDIADQVLIREDPEAAAIVQEALVEDGVELELGCAVERVERQGDEIALHLEAHGDRMTKRVDELLLAVGRTPNVEDLGLEAAGIEFDRGGVVVDDQLRTTNSKIFAVGDVASRFKFTHMADAMARIAIQNALFFGRKKASDLIVPWCTYSSPEIAHVGLYESDAKERGIEVETVTIPMSGVDRAVLEGDDRGFLRVVVRKGKDRILGATLVAEHAGDMIGELTMAIQHGIGLGKIASIIHPYPTQGEVIKKAGDAWNRGKLTPTVKRLFDLLFRIFG